jgi:hypothetical protein
VRKLWISCIAVAAVGGPSWGQKVEVEKPDRTKIIHVETALNHLTVLDMREPVSTVAVGSPLFKVEWHENKVFIEPTEPGVATNLFVWTPTGRLNYELEPAGAVPKMVFAIDQPIPDPTKVAAANRPSESAGLSAEELLRQVKPVHLHNWMSRNSRVAIYLMNSLERDGQVFICYTIQNETEKTYVPGRPQAVVLRAPRYRESLYGLGNYQLGPRETRGLKWRSELPLEVAENQMSTLRIEPGQEAEGVIAIKLPAAQSGPTVLRLNFLSGPNGPINATLVL